jgi:hypothetical protein
MNLLLIFFIEIDRLWNNKRNILTRLGNIGELTRTFFQITRTRLDSRNGLTRSVLERVVFYVKKQTAKLIPNIRHFVLRLSVFFIPRIWTIFFSNIQSFVRMFERPMTKKGLVEEVRFLSFSIYNVWVLLHKNDVCLYEEITFLFFYIMCVCVIAQVWAIL